MRFAAAAGSTTLEAKFPRQLPLPSEPQLLSALQNCISVTLLISSPRSSDAASSMSPERGPPSRRQRYHCAPPEPQCPILAREDPGQVPGLVWSLSNNKRSPITLGDRISLILVMRLLCPVRCKLFPGDSLHSTPTQKCNLQSTASPHMQAGKCCPR